MTAVCGGQLLAFTVPDPMHKVGCTMTMMSGAASGLSTRIVGLEPVAAKKTPTVAHILPFPGNVVPAVGDSYIINGFPYSGMGFGYNPKSGVLDDKDPTYGPIAFLPNNFKNWNPPGGTNCDYTAPDFQDLLLAFGGPGNASGSFMVPIPSLHRADLIKYWANISDSKNADWKQIPPDLLRQIMFRPSPWDHPTFAASTNPNFNPVWDGVTPNAGQWDVDNDGDGIPDSVWVDLGFPVRNTIDGRPYKPLFAILCLDLDGRLNVNAHGTLAQSLPAYYQPISLPYAGGLPEDASLPSPPKTVFAGSAGSAALSRGQGYGPAEVNLAPLFTNKPGTFANPYSDQSSFNFTEFQYLFGGYNSGNNPQLGRYGESVQPVQSARAGWANNYSPLSWNRWFPYGESYWGVVSGTAVPDAFGSPPDTQGFGAVGLDVAGRPCMFPWAR